MSPNLDDVVPGLREQRAREEMARALAFSGLGVTVCGIEIDHLTPLDRVKLRLLKSAYLYSGLKPLKGDAFTFLLFLSCQHRRGGLLARWKEKRRVAKVVRSLSLADLSREIKTYLEDAFQDLPEGDGEKTIADRTEHICPIAIECSFFMSEYGMSIEQIMRTPLLVLQQLHRAWRQSHMDRDEEAGFINESDRMIGKAFKKSLKSHGRNN
jgi:hypothetical protein